MGWFFARRQSDRYGQSADDLAKLHHFSPIDPVHTPPSSLEARGVPSLVTDDDRAFFEDFREFGQIANASILRDTPWRIQERDQANLMLSDHDDPEHGRTYDVFYNVLPTGRLELSASFDMTRGLAASYREDRFVRLQLSIERPLSLPFKSVTDLLELLAAFVVARNAEDLAERSRAASRALQAVLWDALQTETYGLPIDICWFGQPMSYLRARDARRASRSR